MSPIENYFYALSSGSATTTGDPYPGVSSSLGNDDGTIRKLTRLVGGGINFHNNTAALVKNLAPYKGIWICGHGDKGVFETGDGQWGWSEDAHVDLYNQERWKDLFAQLWKPMWSAYDARGIQHKGYQQILIMACCVAGGKDGPVLLQNIADVTNCQVSAYTGLIYVEYEIRSGRPTRILYEKGHRMQVAYPGGVPPTGLPAAPLAPELVRKGNMKNAGFTLGMEVEDVVSIVINTRIKGKPVQREFPSEVATTIFKELFYSQPFAKSGAAAGMGTAQCTINYRSQPAISVNVFADAIAESGHASETFMVSPGFRSLVEQLFNQ